MIFTLVSVKLSSKCFSNMHRLPMAFEVCCPVYSTKICTKNFLFKPVHKAWKEILSRISNVNDFTMNFVAAYVLLVNRATSKLVMTRGYVSRWEMFRMGLYFVRRILRQCDGMWSSGRQWDKGWDTCSGVESFWWKAVYVQICETWWR